MVVRNHLSELEQVTLSVENVTVTCTNTHVMKRSGLFRLFKK